MRLALGLVLASAVARADDPPATFSRTLGTAAQSVTVNFAHHPIRSANFQVLVQQSDGSYTEFTPEAERTYLGTVSGYPGALACGLLKADGTLWARVGFEDGTTWTTTGGVASASGSSFVPAWPTTVVNAGGAGSSVYAAEVGIDSTFNHFTACGGTAAGVVDQCEFSVLSSDMVYLRDAAILHRLGRIIIRADSTQDPYAADAGSTSALLPHVRTFWNTGSPMGSTHDVAAVVHAAANGGLAYVGVVGTSSRYSADDSDGAGDFWVVWRHEVGHNWGSSHYEGGGNPEGASIMSGNGLSRFSSSELKKIIAHRNSKVSVLDNLGGYPFPLPPRANQDTASFLRNTSARIDVLANDSDSNGEPLALLSFEAATSLGAVLTRSAGTGPDGRDEILYTPPPSLAAGVDWFRYRIRDSSGMQAVGYAMVRPRSEVLPPVDHWRLDESTGTTAADRIRSSQDGIHENGPLIGRAGANSATRSGVYFDGLDDRTSIPAPGYNTSTLTITAWIRRDGSQNPYAPVFFTRAGSSVAGLHFGTSNELRYTWDGAGSTWNSGLVVPDNTWCLAALCVSPTGTTLVLRSPSGLSSASNAATQAAEAFNGICYLGYDPASSTRHYKGWLDDVRVYAATLTSTEIESLYMEALNPPTVALSIPVSGASVSPLQVDFAANVTTWTELVDRVNIVENDAVLGTAAEPPYQVRLATLPSGPHTVTARAAYGDWGYEVDSPPVNFTALAAPLPVVTVSASLPASKQGPVPGSFTITRDHSLGAITVPFTLGGTALAGVDYEAPASLEVAFPEGSLTQTVALTPLGAAPDGLSETVVLSLTSGSGYALGDSSSATLTIDDHITSVAAGEWDVATTWNSGNAAPTTGTQGAGDGYAVAHTVTSNNTGSNSQALIGESLRVMAGGVLDLARLHATTNQNVSYNLPATSVENGGTLQFRCSTGSSTHTVAANLAFAGATTIRFNGGSYANAANLTGTVAGSGTIAVISDTNAGSSSGTIRQLSLNKANNPFTGNWSVTHTPSGDDWAALRTGAVHALGTGTVTVGRRSQMINDTAHGLDSLSGVILNGTDATLKLNQPWTNASASLALAGGTPVVQVGAAASVIGSLSGSAGLIQGSGASSSLTVTQQTERVFSGSLGTNLAFIKSGPASLTLAGLVDPSLRLTLAQGNLVLGGSPATVASLTQAGGTLAAALPAPGAIPLTVAGDYSRTSGGLLVNLPAAPPTIGVPYVLVAYQGTLSGIPPVAFSGPADATVDYGTGSNSTISVTFHNTVMLQAVASPEEGGTLSGGGAYEAGETATITATAANGWRFAGWSGTGIASPSSPSTTMVVEASKTVTATFLTDYQVWADEQGLTGSAADPDADPDGDGLPNQMERLFAFSPRDSSQRLRMSATRDPDGTCRLVINKVIPAGTFTLQWSDSPGGPWPNQMSIPVSTTATDFSVHPPALGDRCFYRLAFTVD